MDDTTARPWPRTTCEIDGCTQGRAAGHRMHRIQLGVLNGSPWGWRAGVVRSAELTAHAQTLVVHYVAEDCDVTLVHHLPLEVAPGDVVAVHEGGKALELHELWRSVTVREGGLGEVPAPARPGRWPARRRGAPESPFAYAPG